VALYCGWYKPPQLRAGHGLQAGAVGFHIASSELVNLHNANEKGWAAA